MDDKIFKVRASFRRGRGEGGKAFDPPYNEFDGECVPSSDVVVREDVLSYFGHVFGVLLSQLLYSLLITTYIQVMYVIYNMLLV